MTRVCSEHLKWPSLRSTNSPSMSSRMGCRHLSVCLRASGEDTRAGAVMWSHLLVLAFALLVLPAQALAGAKEKVAALAPSGLVLVMDEKGNELVAQNADQPFVPASVTKIVTAWLALEVLGGDYRFQTRFYLDGERRLYVRGGGDP